MVEESLQFVIDVGGDLLGFWSVQQYGFDIGIEDFATHNKL